MEAWKSLLIIQTRCADDKIIMAHNTKAHQGIGTCATFYWKIDKHPTKEERQLLCRTVLWNTKITTRNLQEMTTQISDITEMEFWRRAASRD